jgi:hypothetical protein
LGVSIHRWLPVAAAVVVGFLGACSSHEVDKVKWAAELEASGFDAVDIDKLANVYVNDLCRDDVRELASFLAVSDDAGDLNMEVERMNFRNACPDRLDELDEALASLPAVRKEGDRACETPPEERTMDQALRAEAFGCV